MSANESEPTRMVCDKRQADSFRAYLIEKGRKFREKETGESEVTFTLDPASSPTDDRAPVSSQPNSVTPDSFLWNGNYKTHPRCLDGVRRLVDSEHIEQARLDFSHDPYLVPILPRAYSCEISCLCGASETRLLNHSTETPDGLFVTSPLAIDCAACGKVTEFFDSAIHGYDGEYGHNEEVATNGERHHWACPGCDGANLKLNVLLYYQISPPEDEEDEMAKRPQDFFDGFSLNGECLDCKEGGGIAWFKCT